MSNLLLREIKRHVESREERPEPAHRDDLDAMAEGVLHTYHQTSPHLGPSKINTYLRCPRQYEYQYVERLSRPSAPAATVGSVVHRVIQHAHQAHWSLQDAEEAAEMLEDLWLVVRAETSDPHDYEAAKAIAEARDIWVPWYLHWIEGQTDIAVEEQWTLPVPGTDLTLQGTIDRIYRANGIVTISDVKTGKRVPTGISLANDLQLTLYSWAGRRLGLREDVLELVAVRSQGSLMTTRSDGYITAVLENTVLPVHEQIKAGRFPASPVSQYGCGYCAYLDRCPVGRGG